MSDIQIQYQDSMGNWITQQLVSNIPTYILQAMNDVSYSTSAKRVRAVDSNGRIVDIL